MLGQFRPYALLSFILSISVYLCYKKLRFTKKAVIIPVILVVLFGLYYTLFMDFTVPIVNMSFKDAINYRDYSFSRFTGGSQMWINLDQPFFGMFLINYLHSYVGNLLGPLPWHISGKSTLICFFVETLPMVFILKYLWNKRKTLHIVQKYVLFHAFVWVGLIAVSNDNIGTATRLRVVAWILILIVFTTVYSMQKYWRKRQQIQNILNKAP